MLGFYSIIFTLVLMSAQAFGQNTVIEGRLLDSTGTTAIEAADVDFTIEVFYDSGATCLLYSEQHLNRNMLNSGGYFNFELGVGTTPTNYSGLPGIVGVFDNTSSLNCMSGGPYGPIVGAPRYLKIKYNVNDGNGVQALSQLIKVGSSPYSMYAQYAEGVADGSIDDLTLLGAGAGTSGQFLSSDGANGFTWVTANLANAANWDAAYGWGDHAVAGYVTSAAIANASNWDAAYAWGDHSAAGYVTSAALANSANWDAAYSWGDHAVAGYLTSAAVANSADWDAAFSWGDHSVAGYLTSAAVANSSNWDAAYSWGNHAGAGYFSAGGGLLGGSIDLQSESEVRFSDADNSHYVGFKAPATVTAGASFVWTLPAQDGSSGQVLQTNGSGTLAWTTISGAGEVNTASNIGAGGVNVFYQKTGADLEFKSINDDGNGKIVVTNDAVNNEVDLTVDESNFNPTLIPNSPAGGLTATNVQAALNELDSEKLALAGGTLTGQLLANPGTLASPGLSFSNGSATGILSPASDDLVFATAGSSRMTILASGNIGIGTTSPGSALEVNGTVTAAAFVGDGSALSNLPPPAGGTIDESMLLGLSAGSINDALYSDGASGFVWQPSIKMGGNTAAADIELGTNDSYNLHFRTNNTPRMTIDSAGWVGVNEPAPTSLFEVRQIASENILNIKNNVGASKFLLDNNGRVGVGNTNPMVELDVRGQAKFYNPSMPILPGDACSGPEAGAIVNSDYPDHALLQCDGGSWQPINMNNSIPTPHLPSNQFVYVDSVSFIHMDFPGNACSNYGTYDFHYFPDGKEVKVLVTAPNMGPCHFRFYTDAGGSQIFPVGGGFPRMHNSNSKVLYTFKRLGNEIFMDVGGDGNLMEIPNFHPIGSIEIYTDTEKYVELDHSGSAISCDNYNYNLRNILDGDRFRIRVIAHASVGGPCAFNVYNEVASPLLLKGILPVHNPGETIEYFFERKGPDVFVKAETFDFKPVPSQFMAGGLAAYDFMIEGYSRKLITLESDCQAYNIYGVQDGQEFSMMFLNQNPGTGGICSFTVWDVLGGSLPIIYEGGTANGTNYAANDKVMFHFKIMKTGPATKAALISWQNF